MILDSQNIYSDNQNVDATEISDNVIDHFIGAEIVSDEAGPQILPVHVLVQITVAYAAGTSLQASLVEDDNVAFGSAIVLVSGPVVALADLVVGAILLDASNVRVKERYTAINYTEVGALGATGRVWAGLVANVQHGVPSGFIAANTTP